MGFCRIDAPDGPEAAELLGMLDMHQAVMRLGAAEIALVQCNPPGPAYPKGSHSNDLWFQHLAIVVSNMGAAVRALGDVDAISVGGPQVLPPRNGGVAAFKFRDPDGHPLELIHFPPGQGRALWQAGGEGPFLGIDHSALAIGSGRRSLAFYRRLGFRVATRSFNHGLAQSRLDGLPGAAVHVTGLRVPGAGGPGLELLRYMPPGRVRPHVAANAVLTDWFTLAVRGKSSRVVADPDGHLLLLEGQHPPS
jgi:catechol 2,3-dioxygenase-like lactoylglutathione lyase family enzyme